MIHETINGQIIPLENIDFIGHMERPYTWGYKIYLKSGNQVWVGKNDFYTDADEDRKSLSQKLEYFLASKSIIADQ
jgi:hypothetical protein